MKTSTLKDGRRDLSRCKKGASRDGEFRSKTPNRPGDYNHLVCRFKARKPNVSILNGVSRATRTLQFFLIIAILTNIANVKNKIFLNH